MTRETKTSLSVGDAISETQSIIDRVDWHQPMPEPDLTRKMIEAKAKLMDAHKKLSDVLSAVEKSCIE